MSQRPPEPSNADIAAWPSKKLSVRRSTTRLAVCSLPIAKLARWVLGVTVIGAATVYRHLTQGLRTAPCTGTYTGYSQPDPTISTATQGFSAVDSVVFHSLFTANPRLVH